MKIIIVILCGLLFLIGGSAKENFPMPGVNKKGARILGLPIILSTALCFYTKSFIPVLNIATFQILRLGYGIPDKNDSGSFLGRIFKTGYATRAAYGIICGLLGALPLVLFMNMKPEYYIFYALCNGLIGGVLNFLNANVEIIETAQGFGFSALLFLI